MCSKSVVENSRSSSVRAFIRGKRSGERTAGPWLLGASHVSGFSLPLTVRANKTICEDPSSSQLLLLWLDRWRVEPQRGGVVLLGLCVLLGFVNILCFFKGQTILKWASLLLWHWKPTYLLLYRCLQSVLRVSSITAQHRNKNGSLWKSERQGSKMADACCQSWWPKFERENRFQQVALWLLC